LLLRRWVRQAAFDLLAKGGEVCQHLGLGLLLAGQPLRLLQALCERLAFLIEALLAAGEFGLVQQFGLEGIQDAGPLAFQRPQLRLQPIGFCGRGARRVTLRQPGIGEQHRVA
jgi:hypothetical protein